MFLQNFRIFSKNSGILNIATSISSKLLIFCEIPAKIRENLGEKSQILGDCSRETEFCKGEKSQNFTEFLKQICKNLQILNVERAKVCEYCRARKMPKNAYLDAKIGFDTAENELSEICGIGSWYMYLRESL